MMTKEVCLEKAKAALQARERLIGLANDIVDPQERRRRYDVSGFNFVAGGYAAELQKMGFDAAAQKLRDAIRRYPTTFEESAADSSADITMAKIIVERHMFENFCECEKA